MLDYCITRNNHLHVALFIAPHTTAMIVTPRQMTLLVEEKP